MSHSNSHKPLFRPRWLVIALVLSAIFAVPCVYDASSDEPSPLAGLLGLLSAM